jgi:hypothetical protein
MLHRSDIGGDFQLEFVKITAAQEQNDLVKECNLIAFPYTSGVNTNWELFCLNS